MVETETKLKKYSNYKDSGVVSLGDIPNHWQILPLFTITELKSVTNQTENDLLSIYLDLGVVRFSDVKEKRTNATSKDLSKYQLVEPGDFVLNNQQAWRGSVGVSKYKGIISPAYIVLSLSEKLNTSFANYFFRDRSMVTQYLINSKGVGSIQRNLYYPYLRRANISLPPLQEQTAIAEFLDDKTQKIDKAISMKKQQIVLLQERQQILIQNAVTGKIVWSEKEQKMIPLAQSGVDSKDSGVSWIGEIPEHWDLKRLKFLGKIFAGINGKSGDDFSKVKKDGFKPFIPFTSIFDNQTIDSNKHQYANINKNENQNRIKKGDILFLMSSETLEDIGKTAIYLGEEQELYLNSFCKGFRIRSSNVNGEFINHCLQSKSYRHYFSLKGRGFTRINIKQQFVLDMLIPIPPLSEQKEISNYIENTSHKTTTAISYKQQEIEKLKEYKSSLINSCVTGKIKVR